MIADPASRPTPEVGNGEAVDISQTADELDNVQEQGYSEDNEVGGETSSEDTLHGDVQDREGEDARFAGDISNPAKLPYSVTGRLMPGSSVYLECAENQYLCVTVDKDPPGSPHDSERASKWTMPNLPEPNRQLTLIAVHLALHVTDKARMETLSQKMLADTRQTPQQGQEKDAVDKGVTGPQARAQAESNVSRKRSPRQERQPTQTDIKAKEHTKVLSKDDQMDLDSETE